MAGVDTPMRTYEVTTKSVTKVITKGYLQHFDLQSIASANSHEHLHDKL